MGILRRKLHGLLIPILAFSFLTGCDGLKRKPLDVATVQQTLSTVHDTLELVTVDHEDYGTTFGYGYREIFEQFTTQDYWGANPNDYSYYDEPFIQFQYMKDIVINEGEDFIYGTKYYDTQTRNVYFKFDTCEIDFDKNHENLVICDSVIGMDLQVNMFNQICSNVVFQNTYTLDSNDVTFTTNRYVNFTLDYDYNAEEPTFILKAFSRNDELDAPYIGYITYQYDYVRVINGALVEFRRFNVETSEVLAPDENHGCFEDFVEDGIAYRVDSIKWYVDGNYYFSKYMSESKQLTIGSYLFELGMFEPYTYAKFLEDLENNQSVNTTGIYTAISKEVYGKDIQYLFLEKNKSGIKHINEANNPHYHPEDMYPDTYDEIRACKSDGSRIPKYVCNASTTLKSLFTGFEEQSSLSYVYIPLYYFIKGVQKDQIPSSNIIKPTLFTIYFSVVLKNGTTTKPIALNNTAALRQAYENVDVQYSLDYENVTTTFRIKVYDITTGLACSFDLTYGDSLEFLEKNSTFPMQLVNYGVPAYTGGNVLSYRLDTYENGYGCTITRTTADEIYDYFDFLTDQGFRLYYSKDTTEIYYKTISSNELLFIKVTYKDKISDNDIYYLRAYRVKYSDQSNASHTFPSQLVDFYGLPAYPGNSSVIYDFQLDGLYIYNSNYLELFSYISTLQNRGFTLVKNNADDGYAILRESNTTSKYVYEVRFDYYQVENNDYFVSVTQVTNPNYSEIITISSLYMTTSFGTWTSSTANNSIKFTRASSNYWRITNPFVLTPGKEFKFIANGNWNVHNPSTSYKGFGYDDLSSPDTSYFAEGEDGKIVVLQNLLVNEVRCYAYDTYIFFEISATAIGSL